MSPCIDKGLAGSKTVKTNRSAVWHLRVRGEPPPEFHWSKEGRPVRGRRGEDYQVEREVFQGGAVAILHIFKSQVGRDA